MDYNNFGIILEIIGFVVLLPPTKNLVIASISKGIPRDFLKQFGVRYLFMQTIGGTYPKQHRDERVGNVIQSTGIVLVIIGLVFQFS